ncbi:Alkylglycerol monooxygenase, partial [Araneus ventricosus]
MSAEDESYALYLDGEVTEYSDQEIDSETDVENNPVHEEYRRNRRCIDKNFGSFFILWDRLFGTFEPEGDQKIAFGVTKPLQSFNPIAIQTNHIQAIWKKFCSVDGFWNKLSAVFKGPGWSPGTPWLGHLEDIPE